MASVLLAAFLEHAPEAVLLEEAPKAGEHFAAGNPDHARQLVESWTDRAEREWQGRHANLRAASRDGQSVSVRGHDYTRDVLARTIGVN